MSATNAMAIYGIEKITPECAYEAGIFFFKTIGMNVASSGFYKYREDRTEEDLDFVQVSLADLKRGIQSGKVTSFRLYCESNDGLLWNASFGYSTNDFGGFYHLDAQSISSSFGGADFLRFIESFSVSSTLDYAIFYPADDVSEGLYYASGENLISVYRYENPNLFCRETGGRFKGAERYRGEMLRMIYPINVITDRHLTIQVGSSRLREWILSDKRHGDLVLVRDGTWVWKVEEEELDRVNSLLGERGVLISWKSSRSSKKSNILP